MVTVKNLSDYFINKLQKSYFWSGVVVLLAAILFRPIQGQNYFDIYRFLPLSNGTGLNVFLSGVLISTVLFFCAFMLRKISRLKPMMILVSFAIMAFLLRAIIAFSFYGTYDVNSYQLVAHLLSAGKNVYVETTRYNYTPLWMFIIYLINHVSEFLGISFSSLIKLPIIICDVGIGLILFNLAGGTNLEKRFAVTFLYWFSPIAILISSYHGQFDSIWILFALLSLYAWDTKKGLSNIFLSIGIAIKSVPIFFLPAYLVRLKSFQNKSKFAFIALVPSVIITLPFLLATPSAVIRNIINYRSEYGIWGMSLILDTLSKVNDLLHKLNYYYKVSNVVILFIAILLITLITSKKGMLYALTLIVLTFFVVSSGFAIQYLLWLLPFGLLIDLKKATRYSFLASGFLLYAYSAPYWFSYLPLGLTKALDDIQFGRWLMMPIYIFSVFWFVELTIESIRYKRRNYSRMIPKNSAS
jgi:hypothetical protein